MAESVALSFNSVSAPMHLLKLYYQIPFNNGINIVSPDYVFSAMPTIYYGDELIFRLFESKFKLAIGDNSSSTLLTYNKDYQYDYYYNDKYFKVYDVTGNIILERHNVNALDELGINWEIFESHNFKIIVGWTGSSLESFFVTASALNRGFDVVRVDFATKGINSSVIPNDVVEKLMLKIPNIVDLDIPKTLNIVDLLNIEFTLREITGTYYFENIVGKLGFTSDIVDGMHWDSALGIMIKGRCCIINLDRLVLPVLGINMLPNLRVAERFGELQNNRPIYEPWLIWGFYKFITSYYTTDLDDEEAPIFYFDLSPTYAN